MIDFFLERTFGADDVLRQPAKYGFTGRNYKRVVVT